MTQSNHLLKNLELLTQIDSPAGYTHKIIEFIQTSIETLGYDTKLTAKGNLIVTIEGEDSSICRGISAHVDTLGLMVRSIQENGTLALTKLGGPLTPTLDGEYCTILTRNHGPFSGTILSTKPSIHVFPEAASESRDIEHLIVKIDERVKSKEDVKKLGIQNGDIVAYDPKFKVTESDFIKSRFLDDKASVAILMTLLEEIKSKKVVPKTSLSFIFSTYEEVGHGASHIPSNITELLAVDMGCIGLDLDCTEYDVSICAKDSSGPYDYQFTSKLIDLATSHELDYAVDIYPMYGSDASAALRGGADIRTALIGPGVANSHGMERTHINALNQTFKLIMAYIQSPKD